MKQQLFQKRGPLKVLNAQFDFLTTQPPTLHDATRSTMAMDVLSARHVMSRLPHAQINNQEEIQSRLEGAQGVVAGAAVVLVELHAMTQFC